MARSKTHLTAGNESGREVTVSGRKRGEVVWATLNTDNVAQSDIAVRVTAVGGLRSVFSIRLPKPSPHVDVYIDGELFVRKIRKKRA